MRRLAARERALGQAAAAGAVQRPEQLSELEGRLRRQEASMPDILQQLGNVCARYCRIEPRTPAQTLDALTDFLRA